MSKDYADGMRWTCEQAGHPLQKPDDVMCICETWAHHVEAGEVVIGCGGENRPTTEQTRCGYVPPPNPNPPPGPPAAPKLPCVREEGHDGPHNHWPFVA